MKSSIPFPWARRVFPRGRQARDRLPREFPHPCRQQPGPPDLPPARRSASAQPAHPAAVSQATDRQPSASARRPARPASSPRCASRIGTPRSAVLVPGGRHDYDPEGRAPR